MSSTPFRVLPWDFFADDNIAAPHVEALQISGAPREFELLKRGTRVYFRLHNGNDLRVWATLDDDNDTDFVRTFRRTIGSGRIGRVFERQHWHVYRPEYERVGLFHFLISGRGALQMRAWCDSQWMKPDLDDETTDLITKSLNCSRLGVFHSKWHPQFKALRLLRLNWPWRNQQDEPTRQLIATRWTHGDARTFDRLAAPFLRAGKARPHQVHNGTIYHCLNAHITFTRPSPTTYNDVLSQLFFSPMSEIIDQHFRVAGVDWEGDPMHPAPPYYQTYGPSHLIKITANPTAHEQLETHLFLRDWLQGKLAPARIDEILSALRV